jgi:predicted nucleic acid-binding Zn ribbon protein
MGFDSLLDIIRKAQKRYPALAKRIGEAEALGRWEIAVGPAIAKHTRAIRVQDEVLWVEVDHPIWKSELHHRKRQILELLNTGRGDSLAPAKDPVKDIFFVDPRGSTRV